MNVVLIVIAIVFFGPIIFALTVKWFELVADFFDI